MNAPMILFNVYLCKVIGDRTSLDMSKKKVFRFSFYIGVGTHETGKTKVSPHVLSIPCQSTP